MAMILVLGLVVAGLVLAFLMARGIMHPTRRLSRVAGKISTGDLKTPVVAESDDESAGWPARSSGCAPA